MAFFLGNSFCKLCQMDQKQLEHELLFCTSGLRDKGLLTVKNGFNSSRLPGSKSISIAYFENNSWIKDALIKTIDTHHDGGKNNNFLSKIDSRYKLEFDIHKKMYDLRPDINSICHTKSHYSILSADDDTLRKVHGEATLILGDIPVIEPEDHNYREMNDDLWVKKITGLSLGEPLRPIRTIIIKKNSVISLGACIHEARAFVEILEECAKFYIISKIFNGPKHILTLDQLRSVGSRYARSIKFGGRKEQINNKPT